MIKEESLESISSQLLKSSPRPQKEISWLVAIVFIILGISMLVGDFYYIQNTRNFLSNSKKADGEVVEIVRHFSDKGTTFNPKISFIDATGKQIVFVSDVSSNKPSYYVGEKVSVLYDPAIPEYAKINSFMGIWLGVLILTLIGLVCSLVGFFGIVSKLKKKEPENNDISIQN